MDIDGGTPPSTDRDTKKAKRRHDGTVAPGEESSDHVINIEEACPTAHPNLWGSGRLKNSWNKKSVEKNYYTGEDEEEEEVPTPLEEDPTPGTEGEEHLNALWPQIRIPKDDLHKLWKPWRKSLIVKVLGRTFGYITLRNRINQAWKLQEEVEPIDLGNDFYAVRFTSKDDYDN